MEKQIEFKDGDLVRIRHEWLNAPEERKTVHVVVNVNEVTQRCLIRPCNSDSTKLTIAPTELVAFEHIEKTGFNTFEE